MRHAPDPRRRLLLLRLPTLAAPMWLPACGGDLPRVDVAYEELRLSAWRAVPRGQAAITNAAQWETLWMGSPAQFPADPAPAGDKTTPVVDFRRNMLLVLSLGIGLRCYLPQIVRITDQGRLRTVQWKTNEDTGTTTSACNHPYPLLTLILVPAGELDVQFTK